jgi:hypothetical protein
MHSGRSETLDVIQMVRIPLKQPICRRPDRGYSGIVADHFKKSIERCTHGLLSS